MTEPKTRAKQTRAAKQTPAERVCAMIATGDCDTGFVAIADALTKRVRSGAVRTAWRIRWDGLEATELDLTVTEAARIEDATLTNWRDIEPLTSARDCAAILTVLLQTRRDLSRDAAEERVAAVSVSDVLDCIDRFEVVDPPKDDAGGEPIGSPSEPSGTSGRPT